jgi:fatty-acyl-CoA synthase
MNATDLLTKRAKLTPDREALFDLHTGRRYTFAELNERANRAANFLRDRFDVHKGDRVSILAQNCLPFVDLLFGLGKIGAIFAPLNWRLTARELVYIVNDLQPKVLVCGPEYVSVLEEMLPEIDVPHCLALEGAEIAGAADYAELLEQAPGSEPVRPPLEGDDAYCILYTSGTTGQAQGRRPAPPPGAVELPSTQSFQLGPEREGCLARPDPAVPRRRVVRLPDAAVLRRRTDRAGAASTRKSRCR